MTTFNEIKGKVFDASGIENPATYLWEQKSDIYYPARPMVLAEMKDLITDILVNYHKTCSIDKYGQVGAIDAYSAFKTKEMIEMVKEFVNQNRIEGNSRLIGLPTYGGRFGTYLGVTIESDELRKLCSQAKSKFNEGYKRAMTSW
jgi:hypothetical protein